MGDLKKKKFDCIYSKEITREKTDKLLNDSMTENQTITRLKEYMQEFYKMQVSNKEISQNKNNKED